MDLDIGSVGTLGQFFTGFSDVFAGIDTLVGFFLEPETFDLTFEPLV